MSTKTVSAQEAASHFSELLDSVSRGDEIIITQNSQPLAKLIAVARPTARRVFGGYVNKIRIDADFDSPLPDNYWLGNSHS